jgi:hypothetical protein
MDLCCVCREASTVEILVHPSHHVLSCLLGGVLVWCWQDPPPAVERAASKAEPPAEVAAKPHAIEGVYLLRSRTIEGVVTIQRSRGYVAVTKRHMLICLVAEGPDPKMPLLRSGVRTWQPDRDNMFRTEVKLGFYSDVQGGMHIDVPGNAEVKRIDVERGLLRIWQDDRSNLEFERIE